MRRDLASLARAAALMLLLGLIVGYLAGFERLAGATQQAGQAATKDNAQQPKEKSAASSQDGAKHRDERLHEDTSAAFVADWERAYPQYQKLGEVLQPYPDAKPGTIVPQRLYLYGGPGKSSFGSVDDIADFDAFMNMCVTNKTAVMSARNEYMALRYNFTGAVDSHTTMSRGKPVPEGPVVRLPNTIKTWDELAALPPEEIYKRDLFPEGFRSLSHPLHSTGHQLFPQMWTKQHPEHQRFDVDFDIPEAYLPEFPPPLFLSTRPDLGDVSRGHEINQANYRELLDGVITPEQLEGVRLLVQKAPTTWFNQTKHRLTTMPVRGTACLDCHVNGHTNAAVEMDPGTRPTLARVRLDTPSLRGNYVTELFSLKRSIRSTDHFSEVEEYFDGDISLQPQIGGRQLDKVSTNRMGDFNAIIDFPPAPKLDRFGHLDPRKANASELRGEQIFNGKAKCSQCHAAPFYTDNIVHDLRVEEFYKGRAEGPVKTFPLRGIKDSPPYFHDGRLPTLGDVVEFFNVLLQTRLTIQDKQDLVAFLKTL